MDGGNSFLLSSLSQGPYTSLNFIRVEELGDELVFNVGTVTPGTSVVSL